MKIGPNPCDIRHARKSAVESTLGSEGTIMEYVSNSSDWGATDIVVTLKGEQEKDGFNLKSFSIKDNGDGMSHDIAFERFRGAYHHSESHALEAKSGRNGVGSLTSLQYFNKMKLTTTTNGFIPSKSEWNCNNEDLRDMIEDTHNSLSKLKAGDKDTEYRKYTVMEEDSECDEDWEECDADVSGSVVEIIEPRVPVYVDVKDVIRRLSHQITFLDREKFPDNSLKLKIIDRKNKSINTTEIDPFYDIDYGDFICHIKGHSDEELHFISKNIKTHPSEKIAPPCPGMAPIYMDLKVLKKDTISKKRNDLVINVCGTNVYEESTGKRKGAPKSVHFLMSKENFKSESGFALKVHGCIRVIDERLKRALRHNKTVLDEEDKYVKEFLDYLSRIMVRMNEEYINSLKETSGLFSLNVKEALALEFSNILKRHEEKTKRKSPGKAGKATKSETSNHIYVCNACEKKWKVPLTKNPFYCSEFGAEKGCGSRDIARSTQAKSLAGNSSVKIKYVMTLGNFLPARYEEADNELQIATLHPNYLSPLKGDKLAQHQKLVGLECGLFAISVAQAEKENLPVNEVYGDLLRTHFEARKDAKIHKNRCKRVWKEKSITMDDI